MHATSLATVLALVAASLSAQTQPGIKWTDGNSPAGSATNAFPWGSAGIRYQQIVDSAIIGPGCRIQDLYVVGDPTRGLLQIRYLDIEIRMGPTGQANPPVANWDTNLPPANRTVVYRGPLTVILEPGVWRAIGLPNSYVFAPTATEPHLCIEIINWSIEGRATPSNFYFPGVASTAAGGGRAFRYDWVNTQQAPLTGTTSASRLGIVCDDGSFTVVGTACGGLSMSAGGLPGTAWPQVGQAFTYSLAGGAPNTPAALVLGGSTTTFAGVQLPFDLSFLGATGCFAYCDHLVVLSTAVNAAGNASITVTMPAVRGIRLHTQWFDIDTGAPGSLTASGYCTAITGT